jgi:hypothetical protein
MMNTREYVRSLFRDYEETPELRDFMEELQSNLEDRIASLVRKGAAEADAFSKASGELGDISALADELSLKRRQEVLEDAYLGIQKYMNPKRVLAYVGFAVLLLLGLVVSAIVYFSGAEGTVKANGAWYPMGRLEQFAGMFGVILSFVSVTVPGFCFLGLTQETASLYPMKWKRALWYSLGAFLVSFGGTLVPLTYSAAKYSPDTVHVGTALVAALGVLMPFLIPGLGLLIFLGLTEKNRLKPWAHARQNEEIRKTMEMWSDPALSARFGMLSGAIWIFAIGLFVMLGFVWSFKFSWLVFVFATAFQLLVQAFMSKSGRNSPGI